MLHLNDEDLELPPGYLISGVEAGCTTYPLVGKYRMWACDLHLLIYYPLSGIYTGEKTVDTCRYHWQWQFEKIGIFLLKLHRTVKTQDPHRLCK